MSEQLPSDILRCGANYLLSWARRTVPFRQMHGRRALPCQRLPPILSGPQAPLPGCERRAEPVPQLRTRLRARGFSCTKFHNFPSSLRHQAARRTKIGPSECRTTVSVTLPNIQRLTPERPCVHMAIRLSGDCRANEMISSAEKPPLATQETSVIPNFFTASVFFSR